VPRRQTPARPARHLGGGAALAGVHLRQRLTEDLDLFVAPDHDNVDRLKRALRSIFDDDDHIEEVSADDLGRIAFVMTALVVYGIEQRMTWRPCRR
jgi:hypothetical protein